MGKYLNKLLVFGVILLLVLTAIDYTYSGLISKSNYGPVETWKDILDGSINADIVVNGSSRALVQVDPEILDSVLCASSYNLGMNGSQINRQVHKYEIFRKNNPKPKVIIQNIDVFSMSYTVGYEKEQFFPYFWNSDIRRTFYPSEPFTFGEKYIPFYRYHGINPMLFTHRNPRSFHKGYSGVDSRWNGEKYNNQGAIEFACNDTTLHLFDTYLKKSMEEGIKVIFVYAPLYYGATQKIINIEKMQDLYSNLANQYDIPVLDYSDMWICYDTTYFYNAMHLNKAGAKIYSDSLANDIKRLEIL